MRIYLIINYKTLAIEQKTQLYDSMIMLILFAVSLSIIIVQLYPYIYIFIDNY